MHCSAPLFSKRGQLGRHRGVHCEHYQDQHFPNNSSALGRIKRFVAAMLFNVWLALRLPLPFLNAWHQAFLIYKNVLVTLHDFFFNQERKSQLDIGIVALVRENCFDMNIWKLDMNV